SKTRGKKRRAKKRGCRTTSTTSLVDKNWLHPSCVVETPLAKSQRFWRDGAKPRRSLSRMRTENRRMCGDGGSAAAANGGMLCDEMQDDGSSQKDAAKEQQQQHHHFEGLGLYTAAAAAAAAASAASMQHSEPFLDRLPELANTKHPLDPPPYDAVINYRRSRDKGALRCVMCGARPRRGVCEIPRQNKDVCKDCDRVTWRHASTGVIFKWCKGCKRFSDVTAFGDKPEAAKCHACRERGRMCYLVKKGAFAAAGHHH
ncbi:unnamed protein product, partial [Phaeothamnion confervicola]